MGEGLEQTIDTTAGETYAVAFDYCGVDQCFGGMPLSAWDVVVDAVAIDTTPADNGTVWDSHAVEFVAAGATTTICFRLAAGSGQGGIDNLSVALQ